MYIYGAFVEFLAPPPPGGSTRIPTGRFPSLGIPRPRRPPPPPGEQEGQVLLLVFPAGLGLAGLILCVLSKKEHTKGTPSLCVCHILKPADPCPLLSSLYDRSYDLKPRRSLTYRSFRCEELHVDQGQLPIARHRVAGIDLTSTYSLQMPVPVPRHSKPYAHPVLKPHNRISHQDQNTVSVPSKGYSPSGPGENWLPAWARTSLRSSCDKVSIYPPPVQDFFPGLTVSGDAAVIKVTHAEAYIPPMHNLLQEHNMSAAVQDFIGCKPTTADGIHDPNSVFIATDQARCDSRHLWNDGQWRKEGSHLAAWGHASQLTTHGDAAACFTPILEDHSPGSASGPDIGSSPLEPLTPFTDFVNRAVTTQPDAPPDYHDLDSAACYQEERIAQEIPLVPTFPSIADVPKQQEQVATTSPTATPGYKKLVEPLSEWIANYIWRACTTGYSLPPAFQQTSYVHILPKFSNKSNIDRSLNASRHAAETPGYLAPCIQNILLATLLQPSAIYLSLWYMVRLPVYFSAAPLGTELAKAAAFQAAFLGDFHLPHEREANEHDAPLRLIVLGFMLANKWLDDHTFSNKTWYVPSLSLVLLILKHLSYIGTQSPMFRFRP